MKAFAPGKLVLTGAYAVLDGAPAIVMATNRGAVADGARANLTPSLEVRAALRDLPAPAVDASALFHGTRKLGLGASSAILVASLAALEAAGGADLASEIVRDSLFARARAAHASAQSGGSGVDVAASVYGGILEYVPGVAARRALPPSIQITVFACPLSARTSELRAHVDRFASTSKANYASCMGELKAIAESAAASVKAQDRSSFLDAVRSAARALARLGVAADAPIVPPTFALLEANANGEGGAFCVSGAGGGDVAVFVGTSRPSSCFIDLARTNGLFEIDVALDEKGVRVVTQLPTVADGQRATSSS